MAFTATSVFIKPAAAHIPQKLKKAQGRISVCGRENFCWSTRSVSRFGVKFLDLDPNQNTSRTQVVRTWVGRPPDDRKKTCGSQTTCDVWPSTQIKTRWPRVLTEIPQTQNFVYRRRALSHVCTSIKTQKKVKTLVLFRRCGNNCSDTAIIYSLSILS